MCLRKHVGEQLCVCVCVCVCVLINTHTHTHHWLFCTFLHKPFYLLFLLTHFTSWILNSPVGLSYTTRWSSGVRLDSVLNMFMYTCLCVHMCACVPRRSCQISVPVVSASLCCSESRLVSWSRFTCSHLQLASVEMTEEEAITGASNGKQMCNYENRGLHLARSLPQRQCCNPLCNPNPDTAN